MEELQSDLTVIGSLSVPHHLPLACFVPLLPAPGPLNRVDGDLALTSSRQAFEMIIPGRSLIPKIVTNVRSASVQTQPCGVDLTLKRILTWTSFGSIDFDNSRRATAPTREIPFAHNKVPSHASNTSDYAMLPQGSYLVEFNETVDVPLDRVGQICVRSSLFRSGALLQAGVMDSGYAGAVGALLQVVNHHGLRLYRDARLGQIIFHKMSEKVEGYSGTYQGRKTV